MVDVQGLRVCAECYLEWPALKLDGKVQSLKDVVPEGTSN